MNHGGLAHIARSRIRLSEDLLLPLSVVKGSPLEGFYYPKPNKPGYEHRHNEHDLLLTPIPYRAWPCSAGLRLEIKHKPGSISTIAEYLRDQGLNILTAQCNRSSHRFATWNLVVEFENLLGKDPEELATLVPQKVNELEENIKLNCSSALQEETSEDLPELRKPVGAWPLRALNHFYRKSLEHRHRCFKAFCMERSIIDISKASAIPEWHELEAHLPTFGFANLDTEHFSIRVAVLKKKDLRRFRSATLRYSLRRGSRKELSSRGILSAFTKTLTPDWDIWRIYTECQDDSTEQEEYKVSIFMEHVAGNDTDNIVRNALADAVKGTIGLSLKEPLITPVSPRRIFISIRNEIAFPKRRDIIKWCHSVANEMGILRENIEIVEDHIAESVTGNVGDKIQACSGMLQFYMGDAEDPLMDWLNAEFFLASFLKIPRTRIVDPALAAKINFERDHSHFILSPASNKEQWKTTIRQALEELDKAMPPQR